MHEAFQQSDLWVIDPITRQLLPSHPHLPCKLTQPLFQGQPVSAPGCTPAPPWL
jgi:hypothetical protein